MHGIYICGYDLQDMNEGVNKKIIAQIKALNRKGISVQVLDKNSIGCSRGGYVKDIYNGLRGNSSLLMQGLLNKTIEIVTKNPTDFIYIRKQLLDKEQIRLLKEIKRINSSIKIIVEIPTFPYDNELKINKIFHLRNDKKYRKQLDGLVDRIVTYSNDDYIFNIRTIQISNGVDYDSIPERKVKEHSGIVCIAVAVFSAWHGYDRFLKGMVAEKDIVVSNNIKLLLVGEGRILKKYYRYVVKNGLENHVFFLGKKQGSALYSLYDESDIALDSMGRHRVGVYFNSSLKGKEYCAVGIPSVSGVETELDRLKTKGFYLRIPATDDPVRMYQIVDFYSAIGDKKLCEMTPHYIRELTKPSFDIHNTFNPVINYLMQG